MGMANMRITALRILLPAFVLFMSACGASGPEDTSTLASHNLARAYPLGPDASKTPGQTCQHPDAYRYAERIAYCNRDVDKETKAEIMREYDRELGYSVTKMPRSQFKIDHYIPLCMGGSNAVANLWPQHQNVYEVTDSLEGKLCQLMANGRLRQAKAISLIREAKNDLQRAPSIDRDLESQLD